MICHLRFLSLLIFIPVASSLGATTALLPYQNITLGIGYQFAKSSDNYDSEGTASPLTDLGSPAAFSAHRILLESRYGFAKDWDAKLGLSFVSNSIVSDRDGLAAFSGSGPSDMTLGFRWKLSTNDPTLLLETEFTIPAYSTSVAANNADLLVVGDGVVDFQLRLNGYYELKKVLFYFTPGLKFRTGGYSTQGTLNVGAQGKFGRFRPELFSQLGFSLSDNSNLGNVIQTANPALGSGRSFARLSPSPSLFEMGLRMGGDFGKGMSGGFFFSRSLWGVRAPSIFKLGVDFAMLFDFYTPDKKTRIKEIPLEGDTTPQF